MQWLVPTVALLLSVGLAGCAEDTEAPPVVHRDSAGVEIVENHVPAWDPDKHWQVDPEPIVEIGVAEGAEPYQLHRVRDAVRLEDGTIVVSNGGSGEIRYFDDSGRFVAALGGHGEGPGEFAEFSSMRLCRMPDERVAVNDAAHGRAHIFSASGELLNTIRLEELPEGRRPTVMDCFEDGTWLTWAPLASLGGNPGDVIRTPLAYDRYSTAGERLSPLVKLPSRPRFVNQVGGIIHYPYIPLTTEPVVAEGGDRLYVAERGPAAIERRTLGGALEAVVRWPAPGRRASVDVYDRYTEVSLEAIGNEDQRRRYTRLYEQDLPVPDSTPALEGMLVDETGHLWVERHRLPWEDESAPEWDVFSPEGRWLGTVETPVDVDIHQIGSNFLLGGHRDELGVERIRVHAIQRSN